MDWEASKENIQPIRRGRDVSQSVTDAAHADDQLQKQALLVETRQFEEEIRSYKGADPLDPWHRYIQWCEQAYAAGGQTRLRKLIEKCITEFQDKDTYKNDERWLYIWSKFASISTSMGPLSIYEFMRSGGHCAKLAKFYVIYSDQLWSSGDHQKAGDVLREGLEAGAEPLQLLQDHYQQYEEQLARHLQLSSSTAPDSPEVTRNFLGRLAGVGRQHKAPTIRHSTVDHANTGSSVSGGAHQQKGAFAVYSDAQPTKQPVCPQSSRSVVPAQRTVNKENFVKPGQWTSRPQASKKPHGEQTAQGAFQVYKEDADAAAAAGTKHAPVGTSALQPKKDEFTHPLKNISRPADGNDPGAKRERPMYDKERVYQGEYEFSIEELRVLRFKDKYDHMLRRAASTSSRQRTHHSDASMNGTSRTKNSEVEQTPAAFGNNSNSVCPDTYGSDMKMTTPATGQSSVLKDKSLTSSKPRTALGFVEPTPTHTSAAAAMAEPVTTTKPKPAETALKPKAVPESFRSKAPVSTPADAVNGNTSMTRNLYLESLAMFSNTIDLNPGPADVDDFEAQFTESVKSSRKKPPGSSKKQAPPAAVPFQIYTDEQPSQSQSHHHEQPAPQPVASTTKQRPQQQAAKPATTSAFTVYSEDVGANAPPVSQAVRAKPEPSFAKAKPAPTPVPQSTFTIPKPSIPDQPTAAPNTNNDTMFDPTYEVTLARYGQPGAPERVASTPFHGGLPPPSFSVAKPWELPGHGGVAGVPDEDMFMLDDGNDDMAFAPPPPPPAPATARPRAEPDEPMDQQNNHQQEREPMQPKTPGALVSAAPAVTPAPEKNSNSNLTGDRLSTIQELSREYRSGSSCLSSGSSAASDGSHQSRRTFASSSTVNTPLQPISEQKQLSFSTTAHTAHGSPEAADGDPNVPDMAVRKLQLQAAPAQPDVDENCDRTGFGCRTNITSGVNPWDENFIAQQLMRLPKSLDRYTNFHCVETTMPPIRVGSSLNVGGEQWRVAGLLGEGAFARAYKCTSQDDNLNWVLKVQKPACPWEFYICEELKRRLETAHVAEQLLHSVMSIRDAYLYHDGSVLVNEYAKYGTLLDLANTYNGTGKGAMGEFVCVYFVIEMLRVLEAVHQAGIIHADIKPDNWLLVDYPRVHNPPTFCLRLIDWGRAIDTTLLPAGCTFTGTAQTSGFECTEMRDQKPWTYQTDYFGLLGTCHVLLFGNYMNVYKINDEWRYTASFKRKWNQHLWKDLFTQLLNIEACDRQPDMAVFLEEFEDYFKSSVIEDRETWLCDLQRLNDMLASK